MSRYEADLAVSVESFDVVHVVVLVLHVVTSKVSMSGATVMNMLQTTHLDLLYFSFRWFPLNSFHYQYNDYYHFYGLLVRHIF